MTGNHEPFDDAALRAAFRALRREEAERAPAFDAAWSAARRRRARRRTRAGAVAAVAVAAGALFVTVRSLDRPPPESALAAQLMTSHGRWRGPSDFLLEGRSPPLWTSTDALRENLTIPRMPQ